MRAIVIEWPERATFPQARAFARAPDDVIIKTRPKTREGAPAQ